LLTIDWSGEWWTILTPSIDIALLPFGTGELDAALFILSW